MTKVQWQLVNIDTGDKLFCGRPFDFEDEVCKPIAESIAEKDINGTGSVIPPRGIIGITTK